VQVDDHVWEEIKNFIKCLIRMFEAQVSFCGLDLCICVIVCVCVCVCV